MAFFHRNPAHAGQKIIPTLVLTALFLLLPGAGSAAEPVEFAFQLPPGRGNPFARDVWAEVITPAGQTLRLPAFYTGGNGYAVRARATELGSYELGRVTEIVGGSETAPTVTRASAAKKKIKEVEALPQVGVDPADPTRFILNGSGAPYTPIGANLAWASAGREKFYRKTLPQFAAAGLNWARIWMVHWDALNLDWLPVERGESPAPGHLDLDIARDWDHIVASAEQAGVHFQLVLQHHGQYSTQVNPNWKENPWNAANPHGFLKEPVDFFTSPAALEATTIKYRYIVARWGYSPAVLAWELFNEVHWVDAINRGHDEAAVAQWHARMADYLRAVDHYHHLVTTSTENLDSPIYARMDYFQPHLYPYSVLTGPLSFNSPYETLSLPVFYGETGDDNAPLSNAQKDSGLAIIPPVWASLMGPARYPAQHWLGEKLLQTKRLGELGAVARFLAGSQLGTRPGLTPFSPRVECATTMPLFWEAGQVWQKRAAPAFALPLDGRTPVELADVPRTYVGPQPGRVAEFPGRATYRIHSLQETTFRARVTGMGGKGSAIRVSVDDQVVTEKTWAAGDSDAPTAARPVELTFTVAAGAHTLVVENPGAEDWFQLDQIATNLPVSALAALGKRSENFLAVWLWHRTGVFALEPAAPVGGTLFLDEVPAGKWTVTWWDTIKGIPAAPLVIEHAGGALRLTVPTFNRHAAVVLTR